VTFEMRIVLGQNETGTPRRVGLGGCGNHRAQAGISLKFLVHGADDMVETLRVDHLQVTPGLGQPRNGLTLFSVTSCREDLLAGKSNSPAICTAAQLGFFAAGLSRDSLWTSILIEPRRHLGCLTGTSF
jgi:hypothetical protein